MPLREQFQQKTLLVYLAVMRIVVGYYFLALAWATITGAGRPAPALWISSQGAWFDTLAPVELLVGISLITGLLVRIGGTLAALLSLNIYFAATNNAVVGLHRLLIVLTIAFVLASAGRSLGVDGWLARRFPRTKVI